jgi:hypothetical protein
MNKTMRDVALFTLIPLGIFLLFCLSGDSGILIAGILTLLVVGLYFLVGIILLLTDHAGMGKAMLLSAGIVLLVGLSTCGMIMSGFKL